MKKVKIIYINTRPYSRDFADQSHDHFYLFGAGNLLSYELLKIIPTLSVENWRADKTVKQDLSKTIDGITCRVFKGRYTKFAGTFSWSLIKALRKVIRQNDYSVLLHFQGMHSIGFDLISWLIPKIPTVITHHGGGNFQYKYHNNKKVKTFIAKIINEFSMKKRFDHFFIQTETEKEYLCQFFMQKAISLGPPYGINFNVYKPIAKNTARVKLGIPLSKKVILSVSRADFIKGVQIVVAVYKELKIENSEIELLCVDVQLDDLYYNTVKESGAIIVGHVMWHDLPLYYSAADVLVYLPLDDESLNFAGPGYVTAEALACGIPVVGSLLVHFWDDSITEVAGIPKNIKEAIDMTRELLKNPPSPEKCRNLAHKYYNWEFVMDRHLKIYNELLKDYYGTDLTN